jgi:hypothetical protein
MVLFSGRGKRRSMYIKYHTNTGPAKHAVDERAIFIGTFYAA